MGKTRIASNALKIKVESSDINLWRIPDQCIDRLMWVHFSHPYYTGHEMKQMKEYQRERHLVNEVDAKSDDDWEWKP